MGFFRNLTENMGRLRKQSFSSQPQGGVSFQSLSFSDEPDPAFRQAIYPQWFFSSHIGQPRNIDIQTLRDLSKSPWVQMVLNTFKHQIYTTDWDIMPEEEEDETDYTDDIQLIKDFFSDINKNHQCLEDLNSEVINDIAEIDSGVWNLVYSNDSYLVGEVPVYDAYGRVTRTQEGLILKPFGQREISQVKAVEGATMLKQVDIHKNLLNYWQYSFKHPRQNPTMFYPEEIIYFMMNPRTYDIYGFSRVQAIQQVLELLIQGTRYNKDLYTNNAIPDIMVSLPKLKDTELKKLKRLWNNQYKGKPHKVGFINWAIENIHKLVETNRDLEWLDGQKWYFHVVFGVFGVSPEEAGFYENSNRSTSDAQERVTVRNALKPYFAMFEKYINNILIPEILQRKPTGLKFKFMPKDHTREKIEFEQSMQKLDRGIITINEYRRTQGMEEVDWGDDPLKKPFDPASSFMNFADNPNVNPREPEEKQKKTEIHKPEEVEDCVRSLLSDPDFEAYPGKTREETAYAICYSQNKKTYHVKELDPGEDIIEEAEDYSDFLNKTFDKFEKEAIKAVDKIHSDKSYSKKQIGDFLKNLFNSVNTLAFAKKVKKYLKQDLVKGLASAENELGMDIGFTQYFSDLLNKLQSQQTDGYTIHGKKWPGIKGVTKEIQHKVISTVQDGVSKNKSTAEIKQDIKDNFETFSDYRSEMIARTETNRILNMGKIAGYKESGLDGKKVWKAVNDDRTSPVCKRLNGVAVGLDDVFIDPETNKSYDHAPAHPHCRSTVAFRPD